MTTEARWVGQGRLQQAEESSSWERTHRSGASHPTSDWHHTNQYLVLRLTQSQELGKLSIVYLIPSL